MAGTQVLYLFALNSPRSQEKHVPLPNRHKNEQMTQEDSANPSLSQEQPSHLLRTKPRMHAPVEQKKVGQGSVQQLYEFTFCSCTPTYEIRRKEALWYKCFLPWTRCIGIDIGGSSHEQISIVTHGETVYGVVSTGSVGRRSSIADLHRAHWFRVQ